MKQINNISPLLLEHELQEDPVIIRVNKFNESSVKSFHQNITTAHNTGQTVIPIIIDSYGGEVYALMSMISAIKHSTVPIATIIEGKAMSCGAILFSFGHEGMRFMDPEATMMIHDVSTWEGGKIEELKASAAEGDRINQKVYTMMARNCGKNDDYFLKLVHKKGHADWYLDGEAALKHNLANELRIPDLHLNVSVDIRLK